MVIPPPLVCGLDDEQVAAPKAEMPVVILRRTGYCLLRERPTTPGPKPMVETRQADPLAHPQRTSATTVSTVRALPVVWRREVIKEYFSASTNTACATSPSPGHRRRRLHNHLGRENWRVTCAETGEQPPGRGFYRVRDYVDAETFCFTGDACR